MLLSLIILAFVLLAILVLEACLRFSVLWHSPFSIKIAYALFLLSPKVVEENFAINQRIKRGGFKSERQLLEHYTVISGKDYGEIKKKFAREGISRLIFDRKYYSGGHGVFEQIQKMHLGLTQKPSQKLQTLEINDSGCRKTGFDIAENTLFEKNRICLLLGGSVAFGVGATSDEKSVAGRIGYYLNKNGKNNVKFNVVNYGTMGFNSLQELISLLQSEVKPDYVVALSGWNEIDQALSAQSKVSSLVESCDIRANEPISHKLMKALIRRFLIFGVIRRFIQALVVYDTILEEKRDVDNVNIYPLF